MQQVPLAQSDGSSQTRSVPLGHGSLSAVLAQERSWFAAKQHSSEPAWQGLPGAHRIAFVVAASPFVVASSPASASTYCLSTPRTDAQPRLRAQATPMARFTCLRATTT